MDRRMFLKQSDVGGAAFRLPAFLWQKTPEKEKVNIGFIGMALVL